METGILSSKGQITIPKKIREFLQIQKSEKIVFIPLEDGSVLMKTEHKPAASLFGLLSHRKRETPATIDQMEAAIQEKRGQRGCE